MYAQLGTIIFEGPKGFTSLEETFAVIYAQHSRINRKPRLQATGDELNAITFEMYLHSGFTDPESDIDAMLLYMQNREILPLILGNGRVVGNFVIPSFKKSTTFTDPSGNIIEATLSVDLLECFNDNPILEANRQAQNNAFATAARNSNVRSVLAPKLSPAMIVSATAAKIETSAVLTQQYTTAVEKTPATAEYYSNKIDGALNKIEGGITKINDALSSGGSLPGFQTPEIISSLASVYSNVQNLKAVLPITDVNNFKQLVQQLKNSTSALKKANIDISNQSIIRRY